MDLQAYSHLFFKERCADGITAVLAVGVLKDKIGLRVVGKPIQFIGENFAAVRIIIGSGEVERLVDAVNFFDVVNDFRGD